MKIESIYRLITEKRFDEAQPVLEEILSANPKDAGAWALKSLLPAPLAQREHCLRQTHEYSQDTTLSQWAFLQIGYLKAGTPTGEGEFPIQAVIRSQYAQAMVGKSSQQARNFATGDETVIAERTIPIFLRPPTRRSSLKRIGVWIALVGGLVLVLPTFITPLLDLLLTLGAPPGFGLYLGLPLILIGALLMIAGFFVDKKPAR
jgi:hypothetical protein